MARSATGLGDDQRLLKLLLPAPLIRSMDRTIAESQGAYADRNEFVADAVWDKLVETAAAHEHQRDLGNKRGQASGPHTSVPRPPPVFAWGSWLGSDLPTAPRSQMGGVSFGLHNRDLPTLWALDQLVTMTLAVGGPVPWADYIKTVCLEARALGAQLRDVESLANPTIKASVGFPRSSEKTKASEERFVTGSIGTFGNRAGGPFFLLGLAGRFDGREALAPTAEGLTLLRDLFDAGFDGLPPHPRSALEAWWSHLGVVAEDEHRAWLKLLRVLRERPTRKELVAAFPEWNGSRAETNCMGLVSRSREWGMAQPEMQDGRYALTPTGQELA